MQLFKHFFITAACLLCFAFTGSAQYTIRGSVTDTLNATKLNNASVVLIRKADSVIAGHARTRPDGHFEVSVKKQGKYFLRITFPSFADYIDDINITKTTTDLGDLPMISKSHLLEEFVLTQQIAAIKIKGDTTEYMADSFKVKEGATVEDLLKKLPGIQVDKNGQIVAQGETVQKVLVDGEEFFSDDPKVVTRSLQADAVSKVQVFDKKSDQSDFTGIDDGQKTKTINLELKEEKKKGYFGKLDAGQGTDNFYQHQAMLNAFKAKRQFSAFGIASNTAKAGLGWQDNDKFGSGNGVTEITEDGISTTYTSSSEDFSGWNGKYNGEGLPTTWTGGTHYANKWNDSKQHFSANYRFARQDVDIVGGTVTQYSLPGDSVRVNDVNKTQSSTGDRHGLDFMDEWKIDSSTTLKLTTNAGSKTTKTSSKYTTLTYIDTATDAPGIGAVSNNDRTITSDGNAQFLNADLLLRKKLKKKGRTISVDVKENFKESKSTGYFKSTTLDTSTATLFKQDQKKINNTDALAFSGKATYTEPLSKVVYAEVNYGISVNNSTAQNLSNDYDTALKKYAINPNNAFSSDYKFNTFSHTGGLNLKFVHKNITYSFGSDVSRTEWRQTDRLNGNLTTPRKFTNIFPRAYLNYKFGKQTSMSINYHGSTEQPTINQLQNFQLNTDPMNVTVGNPSLKQEFNNNINIRFNDFKILQSKYFWASANFGTTSDAITTKQTSFGNINKIEYVNMNGNYSAYAYMGYGQKLGKSDFQGGAQINGSMYHVNNIINEEKNISDNTSFSFEPRLEYDKEDKWDFTINPGITFNNNVSTNNDTKVSYYVLSTDFELSVQLSKKIEISTSLDMMFRQKTEVFTTNNNVIKWDAYIEMKFLKKDQLVLRLSVNDILNQNIGFSRNAQASMVTQNSYNTIRRYGMINLIWNFTHTPAGAPPPSGGGMMIIKG